MGKITIKQKMMANLLTHMPLSIYERYRQYRVRQISKKDKISVVFLPMNVAMWRYQHVYELLREDERFEVSIVLSPTVDYSMEQRIHDMEGMRTYFKHHNTPFYDWDLEHGAKPLDVRSVLNPDIVFYTQPYISVLCPEHSPLNFVDKLLCYTPYGIGPANDNTIFNSLVHNLAWKLYYPTSFELNQARAIARNKGANVVLVGHINQDDYFSNQTVEVWKEQPKAKKRIVWAPHYTLPGASLFNARSNFLSLAQDMVELAKYYSDTVQFAFKPHPKLFTMLCHHEQWGEQRAKDYYDQWEAMPNTQLEQGEFIDLFKTSDAMIHDCSSFSVEYLYLNKPVMFISKNIDKIKETLPEFGQAAIDVHYIGSSIEEIKHFIEDVVILGNDVMSNDRERFCQERLEIDKSQTVAHRIVNDMKGSLKH